MNIFESVFYKKINGTKCYLYHLLVLVIHEATTPLQCIQQT